VQRKRTILLLAYACSALALGGAGCAGRDGQGGAGDGHDDLAAGARGTATWSSSGNGLSNTRSQPGEQLISPRTAPNLTVKWTFQTKGDVWTTPAVDETTVYAPDSQGNLYALERDTGKQRWVRTITEYTGAAKDFARTTPAIDGDALFLGDQGGRSGDAGATVFAVDKRTGDKLWATQVDAHPAAIITQSPVVHGGRVYVGVSSYEEFRAPGAYQCCSFRGSVLALDRDTGEILWRTYMTPGEETPGYTGVAVWGSTPVVDAARGSLYVTTGNNYTVPTAVLDCQSLPTPEEIVACTKEVPGAEQNYFDAVLSLDLDTGKVKWAHRAADFDPFTGACFIPGTTECTKPFGKDTDFGQGAILYTVRDGARTRQLLGAGQKSGVFWALDPDSGEVVWKTQVGPGGLYGGLEWGSAYDQARIYTAVANSDSQPWTLPSGEVARSGLWAGLDAANGKILWQTRGQPAVTSSNRGAVSTANGVVFGGTFEAKGRMYAVDATTGATLWSFECGGSVNAAPAIVDGTVYWGSGYSTLGAGTGGKKLYAFAPGIACAPGASDGGVDSGVDGGEEPVADAGVDAGRDGGRDASTPAAPTWRAIYDTYLGAGTVGHCANCHAELGAPDTGYAFLKAVGQIDGTRSKIAGAGSQLSWFGGNMPPGGPASYPEAERDLASWVAAGALEN